MNKIKKFHKGMSLVEVLVAMTIFSVGAAAVTMAFATAVKYNTHNIRRDDELATQQAAIQNGRNEGLELYASSAGNDYEIVYTVNGGSKITYKDSSGHTMSPGPYGNATEFQASKSGKNDTIFDFQLKSFSTAPAGSEPVVVSKSEDKYKIKIENKSPLNYDVRIKITGGTIYQGDLDNKGYKHSSNLYCHSLAPQTTDYTLADEHGNPVSKVPSAFEIGFKYDGLGTLQLDDSPMEILFYKEGFLDKGLPLNPQNIATSPNGTLLLTINADGTIPATYP